MTLREEAEMNMGIPDGLALAIAAGSPASLGKTEG